MSTRTKLALLGVAATMAAAMATAFWNPYRKLMLAGEPNPAVWGRFFPVQYGSFLAGARASAKPSRLRRTPELALLYAGNPFGVEYNEKRSTAFALEDVKGTARKKPSASCLACKTAQYPQLLNRYGQRLYATAFDKVIPEIRFSLACVDCHDGRSLRLEVNREPLVEALRARGEAARLRSPRELASLVCAQCHAEYYLEPATKKVVFPWTRGFRVEDVEAYYAERGFSDWTHPRAGAPLVKIQHPEFELYQGSVHAKLGLACADCHMPAGGTAAAPVTDHERGRVLEKAAAACGRCHPPDEAVARARAIEARTDERLAATRRLLLTAVDDLDAARRAGAGDAALQPARRLYARAHLRWDWVQSENSRGFHNRAEAERCLADAAAFASQASESAREQPVPAQGLQSKVRSKRW